MERSDHMKTKCPLCSSMDTLQLDTIKTHKIIQLHKETHNADISSEFENTTTISYFKCTKCGLFFFSPPITGSEKYYNQQNKSKNYYLEEKREYVFAKKFIGSSDDVLDIGCGRGAFSEHITPRSFTGLELSSDALKLAEKDGINVIKKTIESYSAFSKMTFDIVCSFQVLEHVANPRSFIKSALNCLKEEGLFIVSVPNNDTYLSALPNSLPNLPPHHLTHWPSIAVKSIGTIFNLDIVAIDYELLSDLHLKGFSNAIALKALGTTKNKWAGIDTSFMSKIKRRFAYRIISPIISKIFLDPRIRPRGHSITVVFKKKSQSNKF